VVPGGIYMA